MNVRQQTGKMTPRYDLSCTQGGLDGQDVISEGCQRL